MRIAIIYKITSPTKRIYIGSTISKLRDRIAHYKRLACKTQIRLYNSLLKHGFENHTIEVVETCEAINRNFRETFWGMQFDTLGENGLNCLLPKYEEYGGVSEKTRERHRNKIFTADHINNLKKARANVPPMTQETKNKISEKNKGNKSRTGFKNSEKQKEATGKAHRGKKITEEAKAKKKATVESRPPTQNEIRNRLNPIKAKLVFNLETGIYYNSAVEAEKLSTYKKDQLRQMLNGQRINKSSYIFA